MAIIIIFNVLLTNLIELLELNYIVYSVANLIFYNNKINDNYLNDYFLSWYFEANNKSLMNQFWNFILYKNSSLISTQIINSNAIKK